MAVAIAPPDDTVLTGIGGLSIDCTFTEDMGDVEAWAPFINQPFSAPQGFDAAKVLKLAQSQLAAAEDHLRFLQTEPAYIHDLVAKQMRGEHMSLMPATKRWEFIVADLMVRQIYSQNPPRVRDKAC